MKPNALLFLASVAGRVLSAPIPTAKHTSPLPLTEAEKNYIIASAQPRPVYTAPLAPLPPYLPSYDPTTSSPSHFSLTQPEKDFILRAGYIPPPPPPIQNFLLLDSEKGFKVASVKLPPGVKPIEGDGKGHVGKPWDLPVIADTAEIMDWLRPQIPPPPPQVLAGFEDMPPQGVHPPMLPPVLPTQGEVPEGVHPPMVLPPIPPPPPPQGVQGTQGTQGTQGSPPQGPVQPPTVGPVTAASNPVPGAGTVAAAAVAAGAVAASPAVPAVPAAAVAVAPAAQVPAAAAAAAAAAPASPPAAAPAPAGPLAPSSPPAPVSHDCPRINIIPIVEKPQQVWWEEYQDSEGNLQMRYLMYDGYGGVRDASPEELRLQLEYDEFWDKNWERLMREALGNWEEWDEEDWE
ncbi:hypothetical protein BZA77DRAFT_341963 [Pyronema omphalodes]|nr:hypothetical protein BZA77DRAFT_341963 [Pyronema omphalodes]